MTMQQAEHAHAGAGYTQGMPPAFNGMYTIWKRDLIRFWRDRTRIAGSLGQPLLFLFVFGAGLSPVASGRGGATGGFDYVQFIYPGVIAMAVLFTSVFSAVSVVWDREFGFLREVLVAPVPRWSVLVGKALGGSTTAMVQGGLMLVFAPFAGVQLSLLMVVELVPVMFLTAFALSAFGLLIAARMRTMEGFQLIMSFLMMPMFFMSGALFPLGNLPGWLTLLTHLDPVSYGVDAMRRIVLSGVADGTTVSGLALFGQQTNVLLDASLVALFAAVMLTLALRAFNTQD